MRVTSHVNAARMASVVTTMTICIHDRRAAKPSVSRTVKPPGISASIGLTRAPWLTCTKFCRVMDMPMALISGARRNDPRRGR